MEMIHCRCSVLDSVPHAQATAALQSYCQQELSSIHSRVHVAQQLQTMDMSLHTPTYQALLSRELLSGVGLRTMGEYKLGWLKGIARPASQQVSISEAQVLSTKPRPCVQLDGNFVLLCYVLLCRGQWYVEDSSWPCHPAAWQLSARQGSSQLKWFGVLKWWVVSGPVGLLNVVTLIAPRETWVYATS